MPSPSSRAVWITSGILIVCCLGFVGLWYMRRTTDDSSTQVQRRSPEEIRRTWKEGTIATLQLYEQEHNPQQAKAKLLALTVPTEGRDAHLALVLAFEAKIQERADAEERLQVARAAFNAVP